MSERTYRPPKTVQEEATRGMKLAKDHLKVSDPALESHSEKLAKGTPLTVAAVKSLYQVMVGAQKHNRPDIPIPHAGTIDWAMCGGDEGLRWARRVLKQERALKSSGGSTKVPELVDFQFGPQTVAIRVTGSGIEDQLQKNGIRAIVAPSGDHSMVFLNLSSLSVTDGALVSKSGREPVGELVDLPETDFSDPIAIDDGRARVETALRVVKSVNRMTTVDCYEFDPRHLMKLSDCQMLKKMSIDEAYLLVSHDDIGYDAEVLKVDEELGLVMGWAIISNIEGEPYFDKQGDHIPEDAMLEAASEFMRNSRVAGDMHDGESHGRIVFAWPMTEDIAKAFGFETTVTGLMVAMKPDNDEVLEKFRNGDYTGFSIGGRRIKDEPVEEED